MKKKYNLRELMLMQSAIHRIASSVKSANEASIAFLEASGSSRPVEQVEEFLRQFSFPANERNLLPISNAFLFLLDEG